MKNFLTKIFKRNAEAKPEQAPQPQKEPEIVLREVESSNQLVFKNLVLKAVDGSTLVDFGSMTLNPGDRMMLSGPAGCGKSAGMAAIRGAWMLGGSGEINVPPEVRFVPQEEYFPDRTLRGLVCSPDALSRFTTEQVEQALKDAGLADFISSMDDEKKKGEYWKNTLSGGQKNKLGFAGIFLHAPEIKLLIIDEITAALDAKSEKALYPLLLERMKHGIIISIAHHSTLKPMHNVFAAVADGKVTYTKELPQPASKNIPRPPKAV